MSVEGESVAKFPDDEVGDQPRSVRAALDDLVAHRGADHFRVAGITGEDFADVAADDDLCGDEVNDLGGFVRDALARGAAHWARALSVGNGDGIVDTPERRRRLPPDRRLLGWLGALGSAAVFLGGLFEGAVRIGERRVGGLAQLFEGEGELRFRDALASVLAVANSGEQQLQLVIARHQLGDERNHVVGATALEQLAEHVEDASTQLVGAGISRRRCGHARTMITIDRLSTDA